MKYFNYIVISPAISGWNGFDSIVISPAISGWNGFDSIVISPAISGWNDSLYFLSGVGSLTVQLV